MKVSTVIETSRNTSMNLDKVMAVKPQKIEYSRNGKDFFPKSAWSGFNTNNIYRFYVEKNMDDVIHELWG